MFQLRWGGFLENSGHMKVAHLATILAGNFVYFCDCRQILQPSVEQFANHCVMEFSATVVLPRVSCLEGLLFRF